MCFSELLCVILKESYLLIFRDTIYSVVFQISNIINFYISFHYVVINFIKFDRSIRNVLQSWAIFNYSNTWVADSCESVVKFFINVSFNKEWYITELWFVRICIWFSNVVIKLLVIWYLTQHSCRSSIIKDSIIHS